MVARLAIPVSNGYAQPLPILGPPLASWVPPLAPFEAPAPPRNSDFQKE